MRKVIITGVNGFIGSHLCKQFCEAGVEVEGWDLGYQCRFDIPYYRVDLCDYTQVLSSLEKTNADAFIHCAGCADVGKSVKDPHMDFEGNTKAVHNLLFALKSLGKNQLKILTISSAAVYGNPSQLPICESAELKPVSPYALHKEMAERICAYFIENYEFDIKILRIFSAYGPGLKKQIFWDMYQKLQSKGELPMFGTGRESRDYIYIDDICQAIRLIMERSPRDEHIYNIANGKEVTIRQVATEFAKKVGKDESIVSFCGTVREGEPINWRADVSKLQKLGYHQTVSLEDGIEKYLQWVRQQ